MKTIFKVFSLEEQNVITGVSLASNGISTEEEMIIFRQHQGDFDSELDAIDFVKNWNKSDAPEHGFEIIKTINF
tara:strand:- start:683 stop:904 length:222 start_codon:yes stop_codon:yes gene_type:complete